MEITYGTWGMMNTPLEAGLPGIAAIGYTGIELAVTPHWPTDLYTLDQPRRRQIRELCDQHNIALVAIAGHTSMCEEDSARHVANMQRLRDTVNLADELRQEGRTPIVVSNVGGH